MTIHARITPRGELLILADNEGRAILAESYGLGGYPRAEDAVLEALRDRFEFILPEQIGALTDAPIFCHSDDFITEDDGTLTFFDDPRVFWFPDYAVRDPWEELKNKGRVVLLPAPEAA